MARKGNKQGDNGIMLLGVIAGAIVGGAIGLVYTPARGEENRKRITEWAANRAGDAQDKVKEALPS
jgi:gas vesicle protein